MKGRRVRSIEEVAREIRRYQRIIDGGEKTLLLRRLSPKTRKDIEKQVSMAQGMVQHLRGNINRVTQFDLFEGAS